jgi:hypothetical protein
MRFVSLAVMAAVVASHAATAPETRLPTAHERGQIVRTVQALYEYESDVHAYAFRQLHLRPSHLHPHVVTVRVSKRNPRFATAAVELRDARSRTYDGTAVVVLERFADLRPPWEVLAVEGVDLELACTAATPSALRDLLCPDPWNMLRYPRPQIVLNRAAMTYSPSSDIHATRWRSVTLPGAVCGATRPIKLHDTVAFVRSSAYPWWARVAVYTGGVTYGDLDGDGRDEAALGVDCNNGGGTAAGQLGFASVVFTEREHVLRAMAILTPRQPFTPDASHVPILGRVNIRRGLAVAHEGWYGPHDGDCCSSGRVRTVWRYASGSLVPWRTIVDRPPRR